MPASRRPKQGDRGILAAPLHALCCDDTIPDGVEIEVSWVTSPNRAWIREYPARPFMECGHKFDPVDGIEGFQRVVAKGPQSGPLSDLQMAEKWPHAWPLAKVKLSAIRFAETKCAIS